MITAAWIWAATPSPTPGRELDPTSVSPGLIGFLATFAVVLATVLLMLDMVRRLRRLSFREDRARQQEAAAVPASEADGVDGVADRAPESEGPSH